MKNPTQIPRSQTAAMATLGLTTLIAALATSIASVALPLLSRTFHAPFADVQWVVIAYLLAVTATTVGAGRLGDRIGHRPALVAGLALFALASLAAGLAPTLGALIAARAVQGLGGAVLMALGAALVREAVPREKTGRAMGFLGSMSAVGTALGPVVGGLLSASFGWRAIFLVLVPAAIAALLLALRTLPPPRPAADRRAAAADPLGTLLLALLLSAYAWGVTLRGSGFDQAHIAALALAVLLAAAFVRVERRAADPLVRLDELRHPALASSLAANSLVASVMMTTLIVGPFFLAGALGLGAAQVGLVLSVGPAVSALSGIPAGRIVDRVGAPRVVLLGLLQMALGTLALALLPARFGLPGYVLAIALLTPGYQLFLAANTTLVMLDAAPERRGVVSGLLNLSRNLGLITGASVMGSVFALATGTPDIAAAPPEAVADGMRLTFLMAVAPIAVSILLAGLALRRARPGAPTEA